MKKRIIYRVAALVLIIGGLSISINHKALAGPGNIAWCMAQLESCRTHCVSNLSDPDAINACMFMCDMYADDCRGF